MSSLKKMIEEVERREITGALRKCNWIMAKAARELGITERMIAYKIRKYNLGRESEREPQGNQS